MARIVKPKIIRGAGRRTRTEERVTNYLYDVALFMQEWMIQNNRIATGKTANSLKVIITRQAQPGAALSSIRRQARNVNEAAAVQGSSSTAGFDFSNNTKNLNRTLNAANLGLVSGHIVGSPSVKFALQGRGAGQMPPLSVIHDWMNAKGVEPKFSLRDSAYLIARKIGREGTNPPHFEKKVMTRMVGISLNRVLNLVKRDIAKSTGRKFVRMLLSLSKDFDNRTERSAGSMNITSDTVTLYNEMLDDL